MLTRKLWDHAINLKEDFVPRKGRTYLMLRQEKEEVQEFMEEQLRKGYIRPSKSPQTSPVFFVGKKDGKKRMVQDYWYLNKRTVKDNYPLFQTLSTLWEQKECSQRWICDGGTIMYELEKEMSGRQCSQCI